ncbi:hypothetical protein [Nocardioides flavescens]|uniref:Uncharacterized protein n=1 Tax=Nocardioides flavescens TaxID=2691959 RepID=A0A6L7ESC9_9ACTN|nr:hypothetical protein [Nocardioides flavescens]MXG90223.1 hypothetical protein [Nocardioides flavescens]
MSDDERYAAGSDAEGPTENDESALLGELGRALGHDPAATPPPERVESVRAAAAAMAPAPTRLRPGRRALLGGLAAGVGGVAGYLLHDVRTDEGPTASPVPMESIAFAPLTDPAGTVSASSLINHTWGTELVVDLSDLEAGTAYDVVFETVGGEVGAGSLLAVAGVLMRCRFNAAPLRADVRAIELRTAAGTPVLRADLPSV